MKKDVLITYVSDLLKSAERNLTDFAKDRNSDSLHRLRVDLKKVRAAHTFAKFAFKEKFTTTALKPLFKDAGRIREVQVHIGLLDRFPHPPIRLIAKLKKEEVILTEVFIKDYSVHSKSLKVFRKKLDLPKKVIDNKIVVKYFDKMKKVSLHGKAADDLHKYRIRIKRMMHVYHMLPEKIQLKTNLDIASIERLQDELGSWHDIHTAIQFLSGETVPKRAADHIAKLKTEESSLFETLKDKLSPITDP